MKGYIELTTNEVVMAEDSYEYALSKIKEPQNIEEFVEKYLRPLLDFDRREKSEFIDWFFSGNWVQVDE